MNIKVTKLIALISFISVFAVSCSNDDNSNVKEPEQKEIGTKFLTTGEYEFGHAGMSIPFEFTEKTFGIGSPRPGQGIETSDLIKLYEKNNSKGLYRAVLKTKSGKFSALFMRNIKGNEMEINIDNATEGNSFDSEAKAIDAPYPNPDAKMTNHDGGQFGWIKITKKNDTPAATPPVEKIELPVGGKYSFDASTMGGGIYSYTFDNEKVIFDAGSPYEMKILDYNEETNKILLEGLGDKKGTFYVIQLKDIEENSVKIARDTINSKAEAEEIFKSKNDVTGRFTEYQKSTPVDEEKIELPVSGKYSSDQTKKGGGIYSYIFDDNTVTFDAGSPYQMKILDYNKETNKILLEGLADKAGTFYLIQLKDVKCKSVKIARDTKDSKADAETIFNSNSDVAGEFTKYKKSKTK